MTQWPKVESEPQRWENTTGWGLQTSKWQEPTQIYRSALVPLIADLTPKLSKSVLELSEEANLALIRFDEKSGSLLQQFAPVLLRSEAASSSQIEQLTASARSIFSAELGVKTGRNALEIVANTQALQAALNLAENLSISAIKNMHQILLKGQPRHTPGELRTEAVWIGSSAFSPVGAEYVGPHYTHVPALLEDLVTFSERWDISPLASTAIAHAQFETIHPFTDGNGRTGRAFAQSMLKYRGVTKNVAVPVSAGLLSNVENYYEALNSYRMGDPDKIVEQFAIAALNAVTNSEQLITELEEIRNSWNNRVKARKDSYVWKILDIVIGKPVINSAYLSTALEAKQPNLYPPLRTLKEAGILQSKSEYQTEPVWRSDEVLSAIDRFAERAGKRKLF